MGTVLVKFFWGAFYIVRNKLGLRGEMLALKLKLHTDTLTAPHSQRQLFCSHKCPRSEGSGALACHNQVSQLLIILISPTQQL